MINPITLCYKKSIFANKEKVLYIWKMQFVFPNIRIIIIFVCLNHSFFETDCMHAGAEIEGATGMLFCGIKLFGMDYSTCFHKMFTSYHENVLETIPYIPFLEWNKKTNPL